MQRDALGEGSRVAVVVVVIGIECGDTGQVDIGAGGAGKRGGSRSAGRRKKITDVRHDHNRDSHVVDFPQPSAARSTFIDTNPRDRRRVKSSGVAAVLPDSV